MGRKLISVFLMAWILLIVPMNAFAQDFDSNRVGSISLTLMDQDRKTPITGAELSLYHVATAILKPIDEGVTQIVITIKLYGCHIV